MGIVTTLTKPIGLPAFWDAVVAAVVIQGIVLILTAMMLDCGVTIKIATYASLFYWSSFLGVLLWRVVTKRFRFTRLDSGLIKFGYFAYLVIPPVLNLLAARSRGIE